MVNENGVILSLPKRMKQTEIGLLPEDWEVVKIGQSFTFKNGLNKEKEYFGYGFPIVNYMDVFRNTSISKKDIKGKVFVSKQELKNFEVDKGDVLFTRTSETQEEIAYSAVIVEKLDKTVFSGFVLRARPFNSLFSIEFCRYVFSNQIVREQVISNATYTTRALTNGRVLSEILIPLPPLPEQEAIAKVLSNADEWIESLEKLIAKKRLIKQGAMQELLTPKEDWELKKLGEILKFGSGKDYKQLNSGDIPVYGTGGIMTFVDNYLYDGISIGIGRKGTIDKPVLLSGKFWTVDTLFFTHSFIGVDPTYIYYQFLLIAWREYNEASGVPSLNKNTLEQIEIKIPSLVEQTRISTILFDMDLELKALAAQLEKARKIKHGMMQELLTGRIRLV